MKNIDTRIQMTRRLLKDALVNLLKEKPIGSVTVKEIVDLAGINRGTFYLHYDSPLALLQEIEQDFYKNNLNLFDSYMNGIYDQNILSNLFASVWKDRDLYCILVGPNGEPGFLNMIKETIRNRTVDEWNREFQSYPRERLNFVFDFVFSGFTNLLFLWLSDDHRMSVEEFAHRIERLGHYTLLSIKEFHE